MTLSAIEPPPQSSGWRCTRRSPLRRCRSVRISRCFGSCSSASRRYRLSDDEEDDAHFENIYLCGLLLYELGSLADVELLCRAKFCRDMDLGMGFDIQFLVGAGVEATLSYLAHHPDAWAATALAYLKRCKEAGDLDWLDDWHRGKRTYFGLTNP